MQKGVPALAVLLAVAASLAATALATAPPVGPLPKGPERTVRLVPGRTFTVTLPKPGTGLGWRVARGYDARVVRETGEGTKASGAVWVAYRAVAPGTTRVVYALTRGEERHAYASRTFRVVVSKRTGATAYRLRERAA